MGNGFDLFDQRHEPKLDVAALRGTSLWPSVLMRLDIPEVRALWSALMAEPSVSVLALRAIAVTAAARGIEVDELCKRFEIDPKLLEDADGRVLARMMVPIWNELPELLGDRDFGLHLGE